MELMADKEKRFTQVEMKFFSMWWQRQTEQKKYDVRQLVREGRLEFVNAGWSMQDEACTHHDDMMNNMMVGHEFLLREFGDFAIPRIGWHIDPFGHSNANPRLFAEMGFDAWFFARIDYEDKAVRMDSQSMQWVWKPFSESLGDQVSIFTHCMPDHYH
jgi:alpha-mannosidase|mmetsp:Transcript_14435/g.19566  ORF Transcript_14435/g.19566 Transcript_14435/m.19566 type:complete len:158 (-) Transcript_14435:345-818(-)